MNILLIDQPLWNRGDESAHKGLIRSLIKNVSNVKIKVMEIDVEQAAIDEFDMQLPQVQFINIHSLSRTWFMRIFNHAYEYYIGWLLLWIPIGRKIKKMYEEADVIIMAPGGINLGGFQDWKHLSLLLIARKMNKKLVYYGRSIGPFYDENWKQRRFKELACKALKYCEFVSLRDEKSVQVAKELNILCVPTVDSAFLDSTEVEIPVGIQQLIENNPYVVFVPNELRWHYAFQNIEASDINNFYVRLVDIMQKYYPKHKIVMLPQTNNQKRNDYDYFCELREIFQNKENIVVIPDTYSSDIQQAVVKRAILMVGARYHSIVFAINQGIPFISLSYEHKMSGLLEKLGETDRMIDIVPIFSNSQTMEVAITRFETLLTNLVRPMVAQEKAKIIAKECFDKFVKVLATVGE